MDSIVCLWGIKASFLQYLARQRGSEASIGGAARTTPSREFLFPAAERAVFPPAAGYGLLKFEGDVQFSAYGGMLRVVLADPWIEFGEDRTVLSLVTGSYSGSEQGRLVVAELVERERTREGGWVVYDATLAPSGVEVFNGVYAPGQPLAPVGAGRYPSST